MAPIYLIFLLIQVIIYSDAVSWDLSKLPTGDGTCSIANMNSVNFTMNVTTSSTGAWIGFFIMKPGATHADTVKNPNGIVHYNLNLTFAGKAFINDKIPKLGWRKPKIIKNQSFATAGATFVFTVGFNKKDNYAFTLSADGFTPFTMHTRSKGRQLPQFLSVEGDLTGGTYLNWSGDGGC